jgi:glucose/arabinose dehydrogenase
LLAFLAKNFSLKPMKIFLQSNKAYIVLLLCCTSMMQCSDDQRLAPPPPDSGIFNKFIPRAVIRAADLPAAATNIKFFPESREFLVLGKTGVVYHFALDDSARYLGSFTVPEVAPAPEEIGLTGIAFDPGFAANRFFYVCFTTGDNQWSRIVRFQWTADYTAIEKSMAMVLNVDRLLPDEPQHGVYSVVFGSDGFLYAAIGDALQPEFAQDPHSLLGKLVRLRPGHGPQGGYTIPEDNPYLSEEDARPEIAAIGVRTPFRLVAWQDKIYIANVGNNQYEEIEMYTLGKVNFGWPFCEGHCETGGYRNPVLTVSHADAFYQTQDPESSRIDRSSIGLGVAYTGGGQNPYNNLLDGRLIFFDVFQGYVRAAKILPDGSLTDDQHIFHLEYISGMDIGPDGYIYGTTLYPSSVFRIELK